MIQQWYRLVFTAKQRQDGLVGRFINAFRAAYRPMYSHAGEGMVLFAGYAGELFARAGSVDEGLDLLEEHGATPYDRWPPIGDLEWVAGDPDARKLIQPITEDARLRLDPTR